MVNTCTIYYQYDEYFIRIDNLKVLMVHWFEASLFLLAYTEKTL